MEKLTKKQREDVNLAFEKAREKDKFFEECYIVQENMIAYGGSFVNYLGHALSIADMKNSKALKKAFPEYWEQYLKW